MTKKLFSMLLVLAVLVSCIGTAFVTEAVAATAVDTDELIVADWLNAETVYSRGADAIMAEYADVGITDVYLLVKGLSGKLAWQSSVANTTMVYTDADVLKDTCTAAAKYGIRVHAWMMGSRDTAYVTRDDSCLAYHFRVGYSDEVNQYINLRDANYIAYMQSLIKELVANYDIAGIHFDTIRYGALYYDWGSTARTELINNYGMTKAEYNAATLAMCVSAGYSYTTNSDGYYIYSASGTAASSVSSIDFSEAFLGQGSTDAKNGALKFAQLRIDSVTDFISSMKSVAGDKIISCAIMPEVAGEAYSQGVYGQDPAELGKVVDYVAIMSYASQYGGASTWPATLAQACAADGCNAIAAIQTFDCENTNADPTCQDIYDEYTNVLSTRKTVNASSSYKGKILGYAFFRGALTTLAGAYVEDSDTIKFNVHNQESAALVKLVFKMQNGVKISSISNKNGWGSATFTISSDKTTLTIAYSSGMLSNYGSGSFTMTYSGTVDELKGACMLTAYTASSTENYAYCGTVFPSHTHSYTAKVTTAATCTANGVKTYTCSCGDSYTESIAAIDHSYSSAVTTEATCLAAGVRTYTCANCSDTYTEEIAKGSHSYVPSYDSETGITTYTCDICGTSFDSNCGMTHERVETWSTGANTHFAFCYSCNIGAEYSCYFEVSERVNATCTEDGHITYVCAAHHDPNTSDLIKDIFSGAGCTNTYTETLSASCNYVYVSNLNGTHSSVCSACGTVAETVDCTYADGICTVCGYTVNDFTLLHFKPNSPETTWNWALANNDTTVTFGTASYGTMCGTNADTVKNPYFLVWPKDTCALNHTVAAGDVVEVRFRMNVTSNANGVTSVTPDIRLQTGTNSFSAETGNGTQSVSLETSDWQTVQVPIIGDVYSEGYVINRILFDPWSTDLELYIGADIEIDYIYIGQPDTAPSASADYLYFDFTNSEEAIRRYNNNAYEGNNFDLIPWAFNSTQNEKPTFDYSNEGTMTITGITGSYAYAQTTVLNGDLTATPLEYVVASDDVIEIRFKTEYLLASKDGTPYFKVYYDMDNEGNVTEAISFTCDPDLLLSGEYLTVTASISQLEGNVLSAIRPYIGNIADDGTGEGKLIIDYIYVGPSSNKPSNNNDTLFFDFSNTEEDRIRYDSYTYGSYNYDLGGWGVNAVRNSLPIFNTATGTMTTVVIGDEPYLQIYADGPSFYNRPLNFVPSGVEMVQVRFKMENLEKLSEDSTPKFALKFIFDDATQAITTDSLTYELNEEDLTSGKYITLTLPVGDFMEGYSKITSIHVVVYGVTASEDATSSITFDYIYVGPKKDGVNFVYFYNEDGSHCLGSSVVEEGKAVVYDGDLPLKDYVETSHYEFAGWIDEDGNLVDLATATFSDDMNLYASFNEVAHEYVYTGDDNGHSSLCSCGASTEYEAHNWDDGVITTPATCEGAGILTYTCDVCGYTKEETVDAEGHSFTAEVIAPTCAEQGYTVYTCSCGESYNDHYVDALGHSYESATTEATCTESGYTTYTCSGCGDSYVADYISAEGHKYESVTTDSTCSTAGCITYTCSVCGDSYKEDIPALGHIIVFFEKTKPTCSEYGLDEHYKCSICGKFFVDADGIYPVPEAYLQIEKADHNFVVDSSSAPTCTQDGSTTYICSYGCGASNVVTVEATGHIVVHHPATSATCTENGYSEHYKCSDCGLCFIDSDCQYTIPEFYLTIIATGHSYTYTNNGDNHTVACSACDYNVTEVHVYTDGECLCGAAESTASEAVLDTNLNFTMSITVGAETQVVYTVMNAKVSSFESFYLEVSKNVAGGNPVTTVYGLSDDMTAMQIISNPSTGATMAYRATYTGINAKEMGDEFTATLYAVASDGSIHYSSANTNSIKSYLMGKINDTTSSAEMKTLAVDMLNYGAAAQLNFSYGTDNLVNADLTADQLLLGTQKLPDAENQISTTGDLVNISASVTLQSKVVLYVTCMYKSTEDSNLKFVIKDAATGEVLAEMDPTRVMAAGCQGMYDAVGAKQMRDLITIELYDNGELVSKTLTWSVESYIAQTRDAESTTEVMRNMVNAMLIYGDSAAAYLAASGR